MFQLDANSGCYGSVKLTLTYNGKIGIATTDVSSEVPPDNQTTDNCSSKFSDSLSTQVDLTFTSKGLHIANLNVRHFFPKMYQLKLTIGTDNGPDILGICETCLYPSVGDSQLLINHFDFLRQV